MRPWWLRWDGLPASVEQRMASGRERRAAVTGWRRWFITGSLWVPAMIAATQLLRSALDWSWGAILALRLLVVGVCVVSVFVGLGVRRADRRQET